MMCTAGKAPTSPEEYEKRIRDLRTVEQWLQFNLNVLRNTIQTMEIQKGTLQALESFRDSMMEMGQTASESAFKFPDLSGFASRAAKDDAAESEPEHPQANKPAEPSMTDQTDAVMQQAGWWWQTMQDQFSNLVKAAQRADLQAAMGTPAQATAGESGDQKAESGANTVPPVRKPAARRKPKAS